MFFDRDLLKVQHQVNSVEKQIIKAHIEGIQEQIDWCYDTLEESGFCKNGKINSFIEGKRSVSYINPEGHNVRSTLQAFKTLINEHQGAQEILKKMLQDEQVLQQEKQVLFTYRPLADCEVVNNYKYYDSISCQPGSSNSSN